MNAADDFNLETFGFQSKKRDETLLGVIQSAGSITLTFLFQNVCISRIKTSISVNSTANFSHQSQKIHFFEVFFGSLYLNSGAVKHKNAKYHV